MKKILVIVNTDWFFLMHIFPIVYAQKDKGVEIYVLTSNSGKKEEIESYGLKFINLSIDRKGYNFYSEMKTLFNIYKVFKEIKPDLVHNVTIKPIIYGAIFSKLFKVKTINTICGLGYSFADSKEKITAKLAFTGYKFALTNPYAFHFFENKEDRDFFVEKSVFNKGVKNKVVNGVGTNLKKYIPTEKKGFKNNKISIILASRMLWEKGIREFVEASKLLFNKYKNTVEFKIYGKIDNGNPGAVSRQYLESICVQDYIKWYGFNNNMVSVFSEADLVVLPTYYKEGCPMVLMEACAMGRAVITTDIPGCRECVDDGINGFVIPAKSISDLRDAIEKLILDKSLIVKMGKASRRLAELKFDQSVVVENYKLVYKNNLNI